MQQIKRGIYYEDSYLGVTLGALVFSHGTILIDAPLRQEDARSWRSALLNQRGGTNRLLVSLDAHMDRTLGARALECTIVAHQKTAQVFRNRPSIFKGGNQEGGADWESYNDVVGTRWASPDLTFTQCISMNWGGPQVLLEYHPGPAAGAIWVIIPEEKVVYVGDAVTNGQPPFLENADLPAWLDTLNVLQTHFEDYLIISGRGGPITQESVRAQQWVLNKILKSLNHFARRNASPEATDDLIPTLLSEFTFPKDQFELYTQRLRTGLYQYYIHHYHPVSDVEAPVIEANIE